MMNLKARIRIGGAAAPRLSRMAGGRVELTAMPPVLWGGGPHRLDIELTISHAGWIDGTVAWRDEARLDAALEAGYAFSVDADLDSLIRAA